MEYTLATLCERLEGELIGDGATVIRGVSGADMVQTDELTFADTPKHLLEAMATKAAAIIVSKDVRDLEGRFGIRVENPKLAFAVLLELFHPEVVPSSGVHPTAVLGRNVQLEEGVSIGAQAVIGNEVAIGRSTAIGSGVHVGDGASIGQRCAIDPNVVIYRQTKIGDRVLIHSGAVIGGDGFGYVFHQDAYTKIPQVGNVVIEDDVEIGCNVCVDRATLGSTLIRQGTKIDNLVQIAHNDHIGKHVIMAGQVGLSGSVRVGDYTMMGGKAGVVDHVTIERGAQLGAASVVTKSVGAGQIVWGYPARAVHVVKRQLASLARLPELFQRVTRLVTRVGQLDKRLTDLEQRPPRSSSTDDTSRGA